jgi:PIN like domain
LFDELDKTFEYLLNFIEETVPDWVQVDTPAVADQVLNRLPSLLDGRILPRPVEDEWAELIAEDRRRPEEQHPPGYLDARKEEHPEGPAGDYLELRWTHPHIFVVLHTEASKLNHTIGQWSAVLSKLVPFIAGGIVMIERIDFVLHLLEGRLRGEHKPEDLPNGLGFFVAKAGITVPRAAILV